MKKLKLHNTESRKKEEITFDGDHLKLYTCGPTVYNYAHIGNLRTYIFEDLLKRALLFFDVPVKHVMNITDVEDKTIKAAIDAGKSLEEYTEIYTSAFLEDLKTLNIMPADVLPSATDHIPQMITMIETLIEKGLAYKTDHGSVYFKISAFPKYGRLSHLDLEQLQVGASNRTSADDEYTKESLSDFVLWKGYDETRDGSVFWESPFGKGRPGWHIECSAMATKHLGKTIDLHCGGVDNIFPHHENEIAQSEGCSGSHFVRHWAHSEHLIVDGKKMSKSAGNFYTLRNLLEKGYTGPEIRYLLISTHYRTQLNFTLDGLIAARSSLHRLEALISRLKAIATAGATNAANRPIESTRAAFSAALSDDLNISSALASLFDFVREINALCDQEKIATEDSDAILTFLRTLDQILGCLPFETTLEIPPEVQKALKDRETARVSRNFAAADAARDLIHASGFLIEDTPSGPKLKKAPQ